MTAISIPHPDRDFDAPLYEGELHRAHEYLVGGDYAATIVFDSDTGDDTEHDVIVRIEDHESSVVCLNCGNFVFYDHDCGGNTECLCHRPDPDQFDHDEDQPTVSPIVARFTEVWRNHAIASPPAPGRPAVNDDRYGPNFHPERGDFTTRGVQYIGVQTGTAPPDLYYCDGVSQPKLVALTEGVTAMEALAATIEASFALARSNRPDGGWTVSQVGRWATYWHPGNPANLPAMRQPGRLAAVWQSFRRGGWLYFAIGVAAGLAIGALLSAPHWLGRP